MSKRNRGEYKLKYNCEGGESDESDNDESDLIRRHTNSVYFHCDVTKSTVIKLIIMLREAAHYVTNVYSDSTEQRRIFLYVHSSGGDAYAGLSAMAHIKASHIPIVTIVDGFVASAATFIILAGTHRQMQSHSRFLIHQISLGFDGKYEDLIDELKNSKGLMKSIKNIYLKDTTLDTETLKLILQRERALSAQKCLKYGFIHEIV